MCAVARRRPGQAFVVILKRLEQQFGARLLGGRRGTARRMDGDPGIGFEEGLFEGAGVGAGQGVEKGDYQLAGKAEAEIGAGLVEQTGKFFPGINPIA